MSLFFARFFNNQLYKMQCVCVFVCAGQMFLSTVFTRGVVWWKQSPVCRGTLNTDQPPAYRWVKANLFLRLQDWIAVRYGQFLSRVQLRIWRKTEGSWNPHEERWARQKHQHVQGMTQGGLFRNSIEPI